MEGEQRLSGRRGPGPGPSGGPRTETQAHPLPAEPPHPQRTREPAVPAHAAQLGAPGPGGPPALRARETAAQTLVPTSGPARARPPRGTVPATERAPWGSALPEAPRRPDPRDAHLRPGSGSSATAAGPPGAGGGLPRGPQAATPGPPPGPGLRAGAAGRCLRQGGPGGRRCGGNRVPGKPRRAAEGPRPAGSEVRGWRSAGPRHGSPGRGRATRRPRAPSSTPRPRLSPKRAASAPRRPRTGAPSEPPAARKCRSPRGHTPALPGPREDHPLGAGQARDAAHAQSVPRHGGWRRRRRSREAAAAAGARGGRPYSRPVPPGSPRPLPEDGPPVTPTDRLAPAGAPCRGPSPRVHPRFICIFGQDAWSSRWRRFPSLVPKISVKAGLDPRHRHAQRFENNH